MYLLSLSLSLSFSLISHSLPHVSLARALVPTPSHSKPLQQHLHLRWPQAQALTEATLSRSFPSSLRPPPAQEFHRRRQLLHLRSLVAQTEVGGSEVVRGLGTQPALTSRRSGRVRYHPRESMTSPHERPLKSVHNGQAIFPIFQKNCNYCSHRYGGFSNLIFAALALFGFLFVTFFFLYIKNNSTYSLLIKYTLHSSLLFKFM